MENYATHRQRSISNSTSSLSSLPIYRIVMLGPGRVGKSALLKRLIQDQFTTSYMPTIEDTYSTVAQTVCGSFVQFELIDTSGNYSFPAMRELRIKIADVLILVFSLSDESSFDEIPYIIKEIRRLRNNYRDDFDWKQRIIIVGNEADEKNDSVCIFSEKARELLNEFNDQSIHAKYSYIETSAIDGFNVLNLFYWVFEPALVRPSEGLNVLKLHKYLASSRFLNIFPKNSAFNFKRYSKEEICEEVMKISADLSSSTKRSNSLNVEPVEQFSSNLSNDFMSTSFFSNGLSKLSESNNSTEANLIICSAPMDLIKEIGGQLNRDKPTICSSKFSGLQIKNKF